MVENQYKATLNIRHHVLIHLVGLRMWLINCF